MRNEEVARMFETLADVLEYKGENPFKLAAYRKAARVLRDLTEDVSALIAEKRLRDLPGVGEGIEKKIVQAATTGHMDRLEDAMKGVPPGILDLMQIEGIGPRTAALVHEKLGVDSVEAFRKAADSGKLETLPGMGKKRVAGFLKSLEFTTASDTQRMTLGEALPFVEEILEALKAKGIDGATPAGSLRRMRETIGDIDLLVASEKSQAVIKAFTTLPMARRVLAAGGTKGSVVMKNGRQVDLRVLPPESFGAALQYFTGSKAHNIRLRAMARQHGMKVSEYGVFKGEKRIAGKTEEEVYKALGLPLIPPLLREDRGEIEAALKGKLPRLVEESDIQGDLHVHSKWSDGRDSIEEMVRAAKKRGYKYVVISDHTRALKIFGGLDPKRLVEQIEEIEAVRKRVKGITILTGTEMDIRADGSLDYPDESLAKLDFVTASVHSAFKQDRQAMTKRIVRAMESPHVDCIGHLTGRLLGRRPGYDVDVEAVLKAAARTGTTLELNSQPVRLDITDQVCRRAKELGVKVAINTDAHSVEDLGLMRFGVATAQRGWLEKKDVLNASPRAPKGKG